MEMFNQEVMLKLLETLDGATLWGGIAAVTYFLVPLLIEIVSFICIVWVCKIVFEATKNTIIKVKTAHIDEKVMRQQLLDDAVLKAEIEQAVKEKTLEDSLREDYPRDVLRALYLLAKQDPDYKHAGCEETVAVIRWLRTIDIEKIKFEYAKAGK